jgi:hypothetical protein
MGLNDDKDRVPPTIEFTTKLFQFKARGRLAVKISAIVLIGGVLASLLYIYLKYIH